MRVHELLRLIAAAFPAVLPGLTPCSISAVPASNSIVGKIKNKITAGTDIEVEKLT